MEPLMGSVSFAVSTLTAMATFYFWIVKSRHERPPKARAGGASCWRVSPRRSGPGGGRGVPLAAHPRQSWVREETREGPGPAESRRPSIRVSRSWASLRTAATCSRQW